MLLPAVLPRTIVLIQPAGRAGSIDKLTASVEAESSGNPHATGSGSAAASGNSAPCFGSREWQCAGGTVGRLAKRPGYSLRANEKHVTGSPNPDLDRQFHYI